MHLPISKKSKHYNTDGTEQSVLFFYDSESMPSRKSRNKEKVFTLTQ